MDRKVYCLLVGIDAYGPPVNVPLQGCLNDMRHLPEELRWTGFPAELHF